MNPRIESFKRKDYSTDFHKHLQEIDVVESTILKRKPKETAKTQFNTSKYYGPVEDPEYFLSPY